ncbi:hypothetical protein [Tautonia plasticadhaerens]|uniref:Mu-like prophage protein Com n=1 Tax=Tautonia plasticadhaerens TaxID=2527974 RepID=A0A518GY35_9BACT|nr:hypothetical protein [Tautonia plasticadhaerens]QDV33508.1 hypothetical protein ElP_13810 [Tautonia plasticadhaerens]
MAPDPLKFRCDRCDQLLGVSPSKAGQRVKCPKCGCGLVVPGPSGPPPADRDESAWLPSTGASVEAKGGASGAVTRPPGFFDGIDLRQEELESLFAVDSDELPTTPIPGPGDPGEEDEGVAIPPGFLDLAAGGREPGPVSDLSEPASRVAFEPGTPPAGIGIRDPGAVPRGPRGEGGSSVPAASIARGRPGRDVAIPRVAFVAWSLFLLLALFLAFVSGLLAGRFVWTGPA